MTAPLPWPLLIAAYTAVPLWLIAMVRFSRWLDRDRDMIRPQPDATHTAPDQ